MLGRIVYDVDGPDARGRFLGTVTAVSFDPDGRSIAETQAYGPTKIRALAAATKLLAAELREMADIEDAALLGTPGPEEAQH